MGGAKALRLDHRIGSITPGKQADLAMISMQGMNTFASMPGGDPAHAVVMYAEAADMSHVMVAGRFVKRDGRLAFPADRMDRLRGDILASRERMMHEGNYVYQPVPNGPRPEHYVL